jgi:hypothetical protein
MAIRYWVGGTGTWDASDTTHWSASSGGAGGASVPGASDIVTFNGSSGGGTVTLGANIEVFYILMDAFTGTFDASTYNLKMYYIQCSGTATKTLNMGSGTWEFINDNTIIIFGTSTNITVNAGTATIISSDSTGGAKKITGGNKTINNVNITAGTGSLELENITINNLDLTGFSGSFYADNLSISGDMTCSATMTTSTGTGELIFIESSGTKTLTSNGATIKANITINSTGTRQLSDNLTLLGSITFNKGTFDANDKNITATYITTTSSSSKTVTMGSGTWTLTSILGINFGGSGLTVNAEESTINITGATAGSVTISSGLENLNNVNITAGSYTLNVSNFIANNVNFTGYTGTVRFNFFVVYGNLTLGTGMTSSSSAGTLYFIEDAISGDTTFTNNGVSLNTTIYFLASGGSRTLTDDLTTTLGLIFNGDGATFSANNKNITCASINSNYAGTKTINLGTGTITLTGTGTVWDTPSSGLTLSYTGTIKLTNTSSSDASFYGGGHTFTTLWLNRGTSTGTNTVYNSNTFGEIKDSGTVAHSLKFQSGTTQTVTTFTVSGSSGNIITLNSSDGSTQFILSKSSGRVDCDYLRVSNSRVSGAYWYMGYNSVDVANNYGWQNPYMSKPIGTSYTNIAKPTNPSYVNINTVGKEQYDDPFITYDDPLVFYDGVNQSLYTKVSKPS